MKTKHIIFSLLAVFAFASALFFNACKKDVVSEATQQNTQIPQDEIEASEAMTAHILDFIEQMEYYRDNPDLKGGGDKKLILEAIIDWEATINMQYCYSNVDVSDIATYEDIIPLPVIEGDKILMADVSERYYNAILEAIQMRYYLDAPFENQKLLVVDMEPTPSFDAVTVFTWIGNADFAAHPPYNFKFGEKLGTCDGNFYFQESDAAEEAEYHTRNIFYEAPAQGQSWYFTNIDDITALPYDEDIYGNLIYLNPNDITPNDNYMDYLIYYASIDNDPPGLSSDVICVENSPELIFYKQNYVNLTQEWIDNSNNKKFYQCNYFGQDMGTYLQHKLTTKIGTRYQMIGIASQLPYLD